MKLTTKALLPVGAVLLLALMFAFLAYTSPAKSRPSRPSVSLPDIPSCSQQGQNMSQREISACLAKDQTELIKYQQTLLAADSAYTVALLPYHSYLSYIEIAGGLAVVALLYFMLPRLKAPGPLKRKISLPRPLHLTALLVGAVGVTLGVGAFGFAEVFNIAFANTHDMQFLALFNIVGPVHAVLGLVAACACLGVLRIEKGLSVAVKSGVALGALSVFVAQLGLFLFDFKEMYLHVTAFAKWSVGGVYLLSNWSVFVVSSSLVLFYFVPPFVQGYRKQIAKETALMKGFGL